MQLQMKQLQVTKRANMLRTKGKVAALDATVHALEEEEHFEEDDNGSIPGDRLNVGISQNNVEETAENERRSRDLPTNNLPF